MFSTYDGFQNDHAGDPAEHTGLRLRKDCLQRCFTQAIRLSLCLSEPHAMMSVGEAV
jgi:hypothetical protein